MRLAAAVMALFGLALVAQPVLANEEAYAFIEKVYATYEEGDGHGIPLEGPTLRDHFTDELALLIEEDAKLGEQKRMNYDPLADAEEWEISDIRITMRELTYDHVLAAVNFYSYIEARLVNVDLVKTRNGWRIDDIQVPDGRLRELFTEDPNADDEDEVAADGGPATTQSASPSEKRASAVTAPATPPVHLSGKPVPQPRPSPVRAEPMPAIVEPAGLEPKPEIAPAPIIDFPLETAAAPMDAPDIAPASPVETPAKPFMPEASAPAATPTTPAAMPGGPAPEPAKPAAVPVLVKPVVPASIIAPEPAPKAAKPPEKEKPKKKAVAPKKGKPKQAAKPKAPSPAAAPPPPPAAEKPPVPPASGAPRFSTPRVPPAAKPAKPPVQAATEKAAPKAAPNKPRLSLP